MMTRLAKLGCAASLTVLYGCANRQQTGAALITAGSVIATAGAVAATNHTTCAIDSCTRSTSKNGADAAGAVGAGVALAAAGAALQANDSEATRPAQTSSTGTATNGWHLARKPNENPGDPETP